LLLSAYDQLSTHLMLQVTHYKKYFTNALPVGSIETSLLMLRMIYKNSIYQQAHPKETMGSFRDMLVGAMKVASVARYQKIQQECFHQGGLMEGMLKLAHVLSDEIEQDAKYYQTSFAR
jgi:hypothetical protein